MEDFPAAPKTKKERIAFLEAKLDRVETDRGLLAMRIDTLLGDKTELTEKLHKAEEEISDLRYRLAQSEAWAEIELYEHETTRNTLHSVYTQWQLEELENKR